MKKEYKKMKLSFVGKIKVKLHIDMTRCTKCYGDLIPYNSGELGSSYHYTKCQNCEDIVYWEEGNLASMGRSHHYRYNID